MTNLTNLQRQIADERSKRGFVTDPVKLGVLLSEEVGEIADAFVILAALADQFEIDIEEAVEGKFFGKDAQREWKSSQPQVR